MKKILVSSLIILIAVFTLWLDNTNASLNDSSKTRVLLSAASLDFKLNGDISDSLILDLGEVKPGDVGIATITVNNISSMPGVLCVKGEITFPEFVLQSTDLCEATIEQGGSTEFEIKWSLPSSVHNMGLNGTDFQFSYSFVFENGYVVTKQVILKGRIIDYADTATPPPYDTVTMTNIVTDTPNLLDTATLPPTPTETVTLEPTATETQILTNTPTETTTLEPTTTETPILVDTPTETDIPVLTDIPTEESLP